MTGIYHHLSHYHDLCERGHCHWHRRRENQVLVQVPLDDENAQKRARSVRASEVWTFLSCFCQFHSDDLFQGISEVLLQVSSTRILAFFRSEQLKRRGELHRIVAFLVWLMVLVG